MSNQYNSYNKVIRQQALQTSPIYKYNPQYGQSPFKKCLAVIPESQIGDDRKVNIQKADSVIQSQEFLFQSYPSLLYESVDLTDQYSGKTVSPFLKQSSSNKQLLLTSTQQKQKQLKLLQEKLFMIRNTNECLRDTIKQSDIQRDRFVEQMQVVKRQNKEYLQRVVRLQEELQRVNQQLVGLRQPQEERYFVQNRILGKSQLELVQQNDNLKVSIQEIKRMYQREIDIMVVKHGEEVVGLETKWSVLVKQKDVLIKQMERRLQERQQQMQIKLDQLKEQVDKLNLEKKQFLREYLQTIQTMRGQFKQSIKTQLNSTNPILISQPYIIDYQPTRDNIPIEQYQQSPLQQQNKNSIRNLQRENHMLKSMIEYNNNNNNNRKRSMLLQDEVDGEQAGYRSLQLPVVDASNNRGINVGLWQKGNSVQSLNQPIGCMDLNNTTKTYYINQRLKQTMISDGRGMNSYGNLDHGINNNNSLRRLLSKQRQNSQHRNQSSSSKLSHLLYSSKQKLHSASNNPLPIPYSNTNSLNSKLLRNIDNKLERIKYQINKQITY